MGLDLKILDKYWIWLETNIGGPHYDSILWFDDDGGWDDEEEAQSSADILKVILTDKPDYIAFGDLRYVKQTETSTADRLEELHGDDKEE
jgi:hypothetical protein